ncbi:hypothetical protein B0H11DRAFT_1910223 [Mycena galericulata]|nr:hypothetical protein B0H11DRAFT_1910223 [Mycena galericulata]
MAICQCRDKVRCQPTHRLAREISLRRLAPKELFELCMVSDDHYRMVSSFIREQFTPAVRASQQKSGPTIRTRSGLLAALPVEILGHIILNLPMSDRIRFGATSRLHRTIAEGMLLKTAHLCLRRYNLSLDDVRLLQTCTSTIISGIEVKEMFCGNRLTVPSYREAPRRTLDIYCPTNDNCAVLAFIGRAAGYEVHDCIDTVPAPIAIRAGRRLTKRGYPDIHVFETNASNPFDAILHLPTTADICAWTLDRIWHGYPKATFEGVCMITAARLPVDTLEARQNTWDILHSNLTDGFWVSPSWPYSHVCGYSNHCPSTVRCTNDDGCLALMFPTDPYGADTTTPIWKTLTSRISWSLEGTLSCRMGSTEWGMRIRSYARHEGVGMYTSKVAAY